MSLKLSPLQLNALQFRASVLSVRVNEFFKFNYGSYPRVFMQCFWATSLIPFIYCLLYTTLLCLWDLQYKPWKSVLNGLKCDIPSRVLQRLMRLKWWFDRFFNQWCLISVQEMHFAHWPLILAKLGPLNCICISKSRFQILTPPGITCICRLWFSSFCCDSHFQNN